MVLSWLSLRKLGARSHSCMSPFKRDCFCILAERSNRSDTFGVGHDDNILMRSSKFVSDSGVAEGQRLSMI